MYGINESLNSFDRQGTSKPPWGLDVFFYALILRIGLGIMRHSMQQMEARVIEKPLYSWFNSLIG